MFWSGLRHPRIARGLVRPLRYNEFVALPTAVLVVLASCSGAPAANGLAERQALVPAGEETLKSLLDAVRELRETGLLKEGDEEIILGEVELLYAKLYEPYDGFGESKKMIDERIKTRFDKVRLEGEARGEARGKAEGRTEGKAEVARNLLKAGVSKEVIVQATGLTMADITSF